LFDSGFWRRSLFGKIEGPASRWDHKVGMCTRSSADGLRTCAVKIAEMKARLPERITRAEAGEEIVIHCENWPVARHVTLAQTDARRSPLR